MTRVVHDPCECREALGADLGPRRPGPGDLWLAPVGPDRQRRALNRWHRLSVVRADSAPEHH